MLLCQLRKCLFKPGMVARAFDPNTWDKEAFRSLSSSPFLSAGQPERKGGRERTNEIGYLLQVIQEGRKQAGSEERGRNENGSLDFAAHWF